MRERKRAREGDLLGLAALLELDLEVLDAHAQLLQLALCSPARPHRETHPETHRHMHRDTHRTHTNTHTQTHASTPHTQTTNKGIGPGQARTGGDAAGLGLLELVRE
eukprot:1219073-Rhodomonas_salina.1